jgi:CRISPR-associated protein (TIGR03986 family)
VIDRFERLANELTDEWRGPTSGEELRPYEPWNTRPNRAASADKNLKIRFGDLVYFSLQATANGASVKEISFSSVWRSEIPSADANRGATAHDFFAQIDPNLLPLGTQRMRDVHLRLTPAELLFGCVESRDKKDDSAADSVESSVSLKGRVNLSYGLLETFPDHPDEVILDAVQLKVLSSPKPPSPAFYFRGTGRHQGKAIIKTVLKSKAQRTHLNAILPCGRKIYLLHKLASRDGGANPPWRSDPQAVQELWPMQVSIQPIRAGTKFRFSLSFENLSKRELSSLLLALHPADGFRHRIGMGKPIGLGAVCIDVLRVDYFDAGLRYSHDRDYLTNAEEARYPISLSQQEVREMLSAAEGMASQEVLISLRRAGLRTGQGISYPLAAEVEANTADAEKKLFRWFVNNDKHANPTSLPPLGDHGTLPSMIKQGEDDDA